MLGFLGLFAIVGFATASTFPVQLCVIVRTGRIPQVGHAIYAASHYAFEYPNLEVNWKTIGIWEPSGTTTRGAVRAFAANGTSCDIVIGPGSSGIAQAMNPLVSSMWLDYSATATTLSDRTEYALFSRVVPTDADATAGMGYLMRELDWSNIFIFCADNAYGQSVVAGLSQATTNNGGRLLSADCILPSSTLAQVQAKLRSALDSPSRVIFAAMSTADPIYSTLIAEVVRTSAYRSKTFLFSESACSSSPFAWTIIPGAFCATFAVDQEVFAPFYTAYRSADTTALRQSLRDLGWPPSTMDLTSTSAYPALAADATRFALRALSRYASNFGRLPATASTAVAWLRNQTMVGASGFIALPTGNRAAANMVVFNSGPNSTLVAANTTAQGNVSLAPLLYCFGSWRSRSEIPRSLDPAPVASESNNTIIIVVVVVGVILIAGVGVAAVLRSGGGKNNGYAPKDPHREFTVIFTDIQSSTAQWARDAEEMGLAVDQHHSVIRKVLSKHRGYEVKTIGDSFMVAFEHARDAFHCCQAIQEALFSAPWPPGIDALYQGKEKEANFKSFAEGSSYDDVWSGLRVRIGMHTGTGEIKFDEVALSYDYYGTVVNTAARVEGVGHGGQVLLTNDAFLAVQGDPACAELLQKSTVIHLGPQPLRGLQGGIPLVQVLGHEFEGRRFPPLRLDEDLGLDEGSDENTSNSGASRLCDGVSVASASIALGPAGSQTFDVSVPKDTPEYEVKKGARKLAKVGLNAAQVMNLYNCFVAAMSAIPVAQRKKVVYEIGTKWRIPEAAKKSSGDVAKDCNMMAARIVLRAAPVAVTYTNPFHTAVIRFGASTKERSGWSEGRITPRNTAAVQQERSFSPTNGYLIPVPLPTQVEGE